MSTKTQKQLKLEKLDELLLDRMIDIMNDNDIERIDELASLSTPMHYLRNNSLVSDKKADSIEEKSKKRLEEARIRREEGKSK